MPSTGWRPQRHRTHSFHSFGCKKVNTADALKKQIRFLEFREKLSGETFTVVRVRALECIQKRGNGEREKRPGEMAGEILCARHPLPWHGTNFTGKKLAQGGGRERSSISIWGGRTKYREYKVEEGGHESGISLRCRVC